MEWNEPLYEIGTGERGRIGVLVSHGFGGSPRSVEEFALRMVEAGHTVASPLLAGHGRTPEEMEGTLWTDWTADVDKALAWLAERTDQVFVTGLSMGGTLALWLAAHHPEVAGLVTVNAAVRHPHELVMRTFGRLGFPRWARGIANDIKLKDIDERAYPRLPMRATWQFAQLLAEVRQHLPLVRCPALIFSSVVDHVVRPDDQREIHAKIASTSKRIVRLHDSYHVATMDNDRELLFSETVAFITSYSDVPA